MILAKSPIISIALTLAAATAAQAQHVDFGIPKSFPFGQLEIDEQRTLEEEAGTPENPLLFLSSTPEKNSGWTDVAVIATPETGVCAIAGGAGKQDVSEADLSQYVRETFLSRLSELSEQVGTFVFSNSDGLDVKADLEKVVSEVRETGAVSYASSADMLSSVRLADFNVTYADGVAETSYSLLYDNFPRCMDVILN